MIEKPADRLYGAVYKALLVGMTVSNVLFVLGIAMSLLRRMPARGGIGDPTPLLVAATVILILTPIARVVVSLVTFAMERDYKFVAITGTVLAVVLITLLAQIR